MSPGSPAMATVNCTNKMGAKNFYIVSVKGIKGRVNRLPSASVGDMVMADVKKEKPNPWKKVLPAVIVRRRDPSCRKDGDIHTYFEYNVGIIVKRKRERKRYLSLVLWEQSVILNHDRKVM
ncbi:60S ribosomal protein L23 [Hibiscus syriacus]|uniref:60S ribosomal protein L23 n=1 Tax=Hibiscus syriacus TaxID=106335 RepID=A0A6A2Y127_HIBSY|nr:60S ribosomal protein L23 [Hibiscus syriacus]